MIPLTSKIENTIYPLFVLEDLLYPKGFSIGLDNDNTYFDYKVEGGGQVVLRVPFYAVQGSLGYPGITVRVEKPFLFAGQHQMAGADLAAMGVQNSVETESFNQVPGECIDVGRHVVAQVESILMP